MDISDPIPGSWSAWGSWSACSETCGESLTSRSRLCDSPEPQFGGEECAGEGYEEQQCPIVVCEEQEEEVIIIDYPPPSMCVPNFDLKDFSQWFFFAFLVLTLSPETTSSTSTTAVSDSTTSGKHNLYWFHLIFAMLFILEILFCFKRVNQSQILMGSN